MAAVANDFLLSPGDVYIDRLLLATNKGAFENLIDYLVEVNLHENIFSPFITGSITLSDSRNLIRDMIIMGDEILSISFKTPGLDPDRTITKTFRIHGLKEKVYVKDGSTQVYILNFCSIEMFADIDNPIYASFEGKPEDIVKEIFDTYLSNDVNIPILKTDKFTPKKSGLTVLSKTKNKIKFVSPGWTPAKCINWICSKSVPLTGAADFLFWETAYGFFFGTVNDLIGGGESIGNYALTSPVANSSPDEINSKMATIKNLIVKQTFDQVSNRLTGYLSSRVIDVDIFNKTYQNVDYDHTLKFPEYNHSEGTKGIPLFEYSSTKQPLNHTELNYTCRKLHTGFDENFDETLKLVYSNRRSNLLELGNFKMDVGIHGRTDIVSGSMINITLPRTSPFGVNEKTSGNSYDELYSGRYLITHITHKINLKNHHISMTVTKDTLANPEA